MANKIKEAEELLPKLGASRVASYFEDLSWLAWAYKRQDHLEGALKIYRKILEETILHSGRGPLPYRVTYRVARSLPSMLKLMQDMGKSDEALALFKETLSKLATAPELKRLIKTLINPIELMRDRYAKDYEITWPMIFTESDMNYRKYGVTGLPPGEYTITAEL